MRFACCLAVIGLVLVDIAGAQQPGKSDAALDRYFVSYCDYTGGLGIGFVSVHTYDYEFRQQLKKTTDRELKRLFVLKHLYRDVDSKISDFEKGIIVIGKNETRAMTPKERLAARTYITELLNDLSTFDPKDPQKEIKEFRDRFTAATADLRK